MFHKNVVHPLKSIPLLMRSRIEPIFIWSWCTAISCLIVGRGFPPIRQTILITIAMVFISASAYLYNDIQDREMDSLNSIKKNRPLPSNIIRNEDVIKIVYLFSIIGLTITYLVNIFSFILALTFFILFIVYSHSKIKLKMRLFGKELTIFSGWPLCSQIASFAVSNNFSYHALYTSILFGTFAISVMPIFVDATDIEEDIKFGVKSFSTLLEWKRKAQLMIFGVLFIMTMTPLTYILYKASIIIPIIVVFMSLIFLKLMSPIMQKYDQVQVLKAKRIGHIYFIVFQLLIVLSTIQLSFF